MSKIRVERIVLSILILLIVASLAFVIALLDGKIKISANQNDKGRNQSLSLTSMSAVGPDVVGEY